MEDIDIATTTLSASHSIGFAPKYKYVVQPIAEVPSAQMRLFLYGTLLDRDRLIALTGRAVSLTPATLRGWRRVALPNSRYPTLRRARGLVQGSLATVDCSALARLAAYEGPSYRLTPVAVGTAHRTTLAWAWIAPGGTRRDWPHGLTEDGRHRQIMG